MGVTVKSFGVPSEVERAHDYLWRVHNACPPKGIIGIFNRSHYEDVLVVKVEKLAPADAIERRYDEINAFEKLVANSGTRILKFMLNVSKEEQAVRLQERVDDPTKQWKFKTSDLETRAKWDDYMSAYELAISRCSTDYAPWHIIPSDRNWVRNAAIARIVRETLEEMNPQYPGPKDWDRKRSRSFALFGPQAAQEDFQHGFLRGFGIFAAAQHRINLHGKIGVVLGDRPDGEYQMVGIERGQAFPPLSMTG